MENGTEASPASPFDEIHADALDVASGNGSNAPVEENGGATSPGANGGVDRDHTFAKGTLTTCAATASRTIYNHFYKRLQPIAGNETAKRIAEMAAMDEETKNLFVESGLAVAEKYGWKKFLSPELVLAGVLVGWGSQILAARGELQELIQAFQKVNAPPQKTPVEIIKPIAPVSF